jgi:hypothetical protein
VEGGEIGNRNEKMPKKKLKKKKTLLERGLEAILGAFLAYLSGSATGIAQLILLIAGVGVVLYAIFAD